MSAKTYDHQSGSFLAAIGQNMPDVSGDEMQAWIGNPKALQETLRKVFCPPQPKAPTYCQFPTWETIEVTGKTIELIKVSVADLGFTKPVSRYDIYGRAKENNLEELDWNMADAAQRKFSETVFEDTIRLAMEPDCDREGSLVVCALIKDSTESRRWGNWSRHFNAEGDFELDDLWLFARSTEEVFLRAEEIAFYVAVSTLRNSTTIVAHVVKVGDEYFEVRSVSTDSYNNMKPTEVKKINPREVSLCPAIAQAIEEARNITETK